MKRRGILLLIFGVILASDLITKWATQAYLSVPRGPLGEYPYGGIGVFQDFFGVSLSLTYVSNTGAAWGILSNYSLFLLIGRILLVSFLIWYVLRGKGPTIRLTALTVIIAGAIGNIFDMLFYKHVIDMVKFVLWGYHYPVFNIADAAICTGIGLLILDSFRGRRTQTT